MPTSLDLGHVSAVIVTVEAYFNSELIGFAYQLGTIGEGGTFNSFTIVSETAAVPESGMIALFPLALGVIGFARRKKSGAPRFLAHKPAALQLNRPVKHKLSSRP